MIALVFAMLVCLGLGLAVVGVVALPARREGRNLLTPHGEDVLGKVRAGTESVASVASATRERTGALLGAGKDHDAPTTSQLAVDLAETGTDDAGLDAERAGATGPDAERPGAAFDTSAAAIATDSSHSAEQRAS